MAHTVHAPNTCRRCALRDRSVLEDAAPVDSVRRRRRLLIVCLLVGKDASLSSHTRSLAERLSVVRAKIMNVADPIISVIATMGCGPALGRHLTCLSLPRGPHSHQVYTHFVCDVSSQRMDGLCVATSNSKANTPHHHSTGRRTQPGVGAGFEERSGDCSLVRDNAWPQPHPLTLSSTKLYKKGTGHEYRHSPMEFWGKGHRG